MDIEIKIDENYKEMKIMILTAQITEEVNEVMKRISSTPLRAVAGYMDDTLILIEQEDILRVFASEQKVFVQTSEGEYTVKLRLYELEERLDKNMFVRISKSEIINLKKVKRFDLSFSGTICVEMEGNIITYVSRRYVSALKKILGI